MTLQGRAWGRSVVMLPLAIAAGCAPKTTSILPPTTSIPTASAPITSAPSRVPLHGKGTIYLIPCGSYPTSDVKRQAAYFKEKYRVQIQVLPAVDESAAIDPERLQVSGQRLSAIIRSRYAALDAKPSNYFIGLTASDLNMEGEGLNYVLSYRQSDQPSDGLAIVSKSRFLARTPDGLTDRSLIQQRMRKLISKNIGILYFHLEPSNDPNSVLFSGINSPADVDRMSEDF